MKEYEIEDNNKKLGTIKIYNSDNNPYMFYDNNNIKYDIINELIKMYYINIFVKDDNELLEIVKKYKNHNEVNNEIELIKKYNNIRNIKSNNIIIKLNNKELYSIGYNVSNINLCSLFESKLYFVKKVLENNIYDISIDDIENNYNNFINSKEYEFYTIEEKNNIINNYINDLNNIISNIESNTVFRYKKDFIKEILVNK